MVNFVDFLCKSDSKTLLKFCGEKSGKITASQKTVENQRFSHSFSNNIRNELNKVFLSYKRWVIHTFHIAYNYYY